MVPLPEFGEEFYGGGVFQRGEEIGDWAVLAGEERGTLFLPTQSRLQSRKHWIAYALKARGVIQVDAGAAAALSRGGKSLLPSGVRAVGGDFQARLGNVGNFANLEGEGLGVRKNILLRQGCKDDFDGRDQSFCSQHGRV